MLHRVATRPQSVCAVIRSSSRRHLSQNASTHYPIWGMSDPQNPVYQSLHQIAETSSQVMQTLHDTTQMPWWATIVCSGFLIRGALSATAGVYSIRNAAKAAGAASGIQNVIAAARRANAAEATLDQPQAEKAMSALRNAMLIRRGIWAAMRRAQARPWLSLALPFVQIPVLVSAVLGARHSVMMGDESFEREGILWFTDLTTHDPYYVVPAVALGLAYASLEVMVPRKGSKVAAGEAREGSEQQKPVTNAAVLGDGLAKLLRDSGQTVIILSAPFSLDLPSGLFLLMAANSAFTVAWLQFIRSQLGQGIILSGLPQAPRASPTPAHPPDGTASGHGATGALSGGDGLAVDSHGKVALASTAQGTPWAGAVLARGTHTEARNNAVRRGDASRIEATLSRASTGSTTSSSGVSSETEVQAAPLQQQAVPLQKPVPIPLQAGLQEFVQHMHMHPRFLYHADGPVDLDKERSYIERIRTSFRKDMPWLQGTPAAFSLAVAGGDKRMPWFNSPAWKPQPPAPAPIKSIPIPALGLEAGTGSAGLADKAIMSMQLNFARAWGGSVALPVPGSRPRDRMRVDPRLFTRDRGGEHGKEGEGVRTDVKVEAGGGNVSIAAEKRAAAAGQSGWVKVDIDDPLYILLPDKLQAVHKAPRDSLSSSLPLSFPEGTGGQAVGKANATAGAASRKAQIVQSAAPSTSNSDGASTTGAAGVSRSRQSSTSMATVPVQDEKESTQASQQPPGAMKVDETQERRAKKWLAELMHSIRGHRD